MALDKNGKTGDNAWTLEIAALCFARASWRDRPYAQNAQSNQPHAHDGRRRFSLAILAILGSYLPAPTASHQNMR
jgi:hypothetical protein